MSERTICYCGAVIVKQNGSGWKHADTDSVWCYDDERDLDPESRCDADPDPKAGR